MKTHPTLDRRERKCREITDKTSIAKKHMNTC